jgi:hypothetical protein
MKVTKIIAAAGLIAFGVGTQSDAVAKGKPAPPKAVAVTPSCMLGFKAGLTKNGRYQCVSKSVACPTGRTPVSPQFDHETNRYFYYCSPTTTNDTLRGPAQQVEPQCIEGFKPTLSTVGSKYYVCRSKASPTCLKGYKLVGSRAYSSSGFYYACLKI